MASRPVPGKPKEIGEPYQGTHGKSFNVKGGSNNWQSENAVDLAVPKGTPVYAVANGTIGSRIGSLGSGGRFAGLRVYVDTANNSYYYAHLSKLVVKAGEKVTAGQLIGYSGEANGVAHLHFASKRGNPHDAWSGGSTPQAPSATPDPGSPDPSSPAPTLVPPMAVPPPGQSSIGSSGAEMPGSQSYRIDPTHVVSLWQMVGNSDFVSPETQQLVQNANLSTGS